ncbi:MAG TPA: GatB/YqeY domain-containing protein [Candidatus Paceibacterota bacterium]|nr:GatB/YqeY domain-containing protein [Candidatus Paceibacterota bacterium]
MPLHTQIKDGIKEAMKAHDQARLEAFRSVLTACTNELVAKGRQPNEELSDDDVLTVIRRLVKQRKDSIAQFDAAGRADLSSIEREQLSHLEGFLPALLSEDAVREVVLMVKEKLGVTDKQKAGQLVGAVMKELAGKADGGVVKKIVEESFT